MSIKNLEIKPSEAKAVEIASLPTRPTSSATYGGRGLTAQEMKKAYDAYPALIKERFNALIADLLSGIAINDIPFSIPAHEPFGENIEQTVKGFLDAVGAILDFGTDNARTIFGFVKQFVNDVAKATSLAYDKSTQLLSLTIDGEEKSVKIDFDQFNNEITILKDRMELAETDIGTLQTDMSVANDDISYLKESKLDKTGGLISGNLDVAGSLFVNGENYDTTVSSLKNLVDLLSTLLFNTIITMTEVEDTYTGRVTAGGLPVVSNTPTTVHKITGASAASINLAKLADGTFTSNGVTFVSSSETGAVHISGSLEEGATYASLTVSYFFLRQGTYTLYVPHKVDKVGWIVRNEQGEQVDEILWSGTNTVKSFTVGADGSYELYIFVHGSLSTALNYTETPMIILGDATASLPAFVPYYAGLKNASFKGIASTGRNLIEFEAIYTGGGALAAPLGTDVVNGGVTFTLYKNRCVIKGTNTKTSTIGYNLRLKKPLPKGMTVSVQVFKNGERQNTFYISTNENGSNGQPWYTSKPTQEVVSNINNIWVYVTAGETVDYEIQFMFVLGSEIPTTFEEPVSDTSFQLSAARSLHKWDYIDIDNQRLVTGTAEVTQETEFTDEELAAHPDYIISADRKTIVYPLETPTTVPLTVPKTYTAWRNGSETVDTGAADSLPPTITQTYYEEVTA